MFDWVKRKMRGCKHDGVPVGKFLGCGIDGAVYIHPDNPHRVVKLGKQKFPDDNFDKLLKEQKRTYEYMLNHKPKGFARVYGFSQLGCGQCGIEYVAEMERLYPLANTELAIVIHLKQAANLRYQIKDQQMSWAKFNRNVCFNTPEINKRFVYRAYKNISSAKIGHLDVHDFNVMKTRLGSYKLIDFDHLVIPEENK